MNQHSLRATAFAGAIVITATIGPASAQCDPANDVPLCRWIGPTTSCETISCDDWFTSFSFGNGRGISIAGVDGDGRQDVYNFGSGNLWLNTNGSPSNQNLPTWMPAPVNGIPAPTPAHRYGSSFADFDNDGRPDLATEPRHTGDPACPAATCFDARINILRNNSAGGTISFTGGGGLSGGQPLIHPWPLSGRAETIGWVDVDFDGGLDVIIPCYVNDPPGSRNRNYLLINEVIDGGSFELVSHSGVEQNVGEPNPEGAQFCDVDQDGDADWFSNSLLYRRIDGATAGGPYFARVDSGVSGICPNAGFGGDCNDSTLNGDEGAVFLDYDRDGDFDLAVAHVDPLNEVRIYDNRGDGSFQPVDVFNGTTSPPFQHTGMSAEDWDNDGDIDLTTSNIFWENRMDEPVNAFCRANSPVVCFEGLQPYLLPSWFDWDLDGDLDCAIAHYKSSTGLPAFFMVNTTQTTASLSAPSYVRIRPLTQQNGVDLETEYGAVAEVRVAGETLRRRKFTASGHGYLNQSEYTLHFGLEGVAKATFDVAVDFINDPEEGNWRVDRHVNGALEMLSQSTFTGTHQVDVFRNGDVRINGTLHPAGTDEGPLLTNTGGGLEVVGEPGIGTLTNASADEWVGLDVATTENVRLCEIVIDGELADPGTGFNLALWKFDPGGAHELIGSMAVEPSAGNQRAFVTTDWVLAGNSIYRIVAHVAKHRTTEFGGPSFESGLLTLGGMRYVDLDPQSGQTVFTAPVEEDPRVLYLAARYRPTEAEAD